MIKEETKMKKFYEAPQVEVTEFLLEDSVTVISFVNPLTNDSDGNGDHWGRMPAW